ncbi:hypothetical protein A7982_13722 [Minicystis rosea]|nr:hypothetical protein A7982_13722 [Minicystis rosea]
MSARGSRSEQVAPRPLGAGHDAPALFRFAASVQQAAARGRPLGPALLADAQAAQRALLAGEIEPLFAVLRAAAGGPLLVRILIPDPELQSVPWEALCKPGEALGFWGSSPDLLPVRGVTTSEPWQPREVRGAVRVLAIAPGGAGALSPLKSALAERIASGEVEWLDPIEGPAARPAALFDRLRREPVPHVLHFLGHGGQDKGMPVLRLADDDDGEESWLQVELLAQQLRAGFRGVLRLVILEACEGAKPSVFASAAEILARAGADAVVAHLWPVKADVARTFSLELYRALAGADRGGGDIARAMNEARRAILATFEASAEAASPVLYLRGSNGTIFDFKGRKVAPLRAGTAAPTTSGIDPALVSVLRAPFSLVLGDRWEGDGAALDSFRDKLQKELAKAADPAPAGLPLSALAQRFALRRGADKLGSEFQKAFRSGATAPPLIAALARHIGPGVHTTLLRSPWLEQCLAEQHPDRTLYVIQPSDDGALLMKRGSGEDWEELAAPPTSLDLDEDILVLRPCRGYTPEQVFTRPLLTEDDYQLGLRDLWSALPLDLGNAILSTMSYRPALLLGLSMLTLHHRMLLANLYARGLPRGSLGLIEPEDKERKLWESGAGLPGKSGIEVIETGVEALAAALEATAEEEG